MMQREHQDHGSLPVRPPGRRSGQALVEFVIGLVSIIVLAAVIVQLAYLSTARLRVMSRAREWAGQFSFNRMIVPDDPDFMALRHEGPDEGRYSKDDEFDPGAIQGFRNTILDKTVATPADWGTLAAVPRDPFRPYQSAPDPADVMGLVSGHDREVVQLLPGVRSLLYDAPSIEVKERVWMATSRGIY